MSKNQPDPLAAVVAEVADSEFESPAQSESWELLQVSQRCSVHRHFQVVLASTGRPSAWPTRCWGWRGRTEAG